MRMKLFLRLRSIKSEKKGIVFLMLSVTPLTNCEGTMLILIECMVLYHQYIHQGGQSVLIKVNHPYMLHHSYLASVIIQLT